MKILIILFLSLAVFFTLGCESDTYSINEQRDELAPAVGVDPAELQFLSDCQFQLVKTQDGSTGPVKQGIVALSEREFFLMTGDVTKDNYRIAIPMADLEGVSKLADQFHLTYKGEVMVFWLRDAATDDLTEDKYDSVYQALANHQVPLVAATDSYQRPLYSWDGNHTTHQGGFYIPGVRLSGAYGQVRNSNTKGTVVTGIR